MADQFLPVLMTLGVAFAFAVILLGFVMWLPAHRFKQELRVRDGFLIVTLFWVVLALVGWFYPQSWLSTGPLLIGIGIRPNIALLESTPVRCEQGAVIDTHCACNVDNVYAAGDVAADVVRVVAFQLRSGARVPRQHAVAKARRKALDLRLDARLGDPFGHVVGQQRPVQVRAQQQPAHGSGTRQAPKKS